MEEILASIRRIIADDDDPSASHADKSSHPAHPDDVLDLADMPDTRVHVSDALEIEAPDLSFRQPPEQPKRGAANGLAAHVSPQFRVTTPSPDAGSETGPAPGRYPGQQAESLVSTETTASVSQAFNILSHTILAQNARTLEDLVREMLKPMLKVWLDDNLPPLVERLVRAEIERVARGNW